MGKEYDEMRALAAKVVGAPVAGIIILTILTAVTGR